MFRRLTNKEFKRVNSLLGLYDDGDLGVSPNIFYGSSGELVAYKVTMAAMFLLYSDLGIMNEEDISLSTLNSDSDSLVDRVALGMFEDLSYESSFFSAFESVGWERKEASGIVSGLMDLEKTEDYYGAEVEYVCFHNESWAKFFKAVRENKLEKSRLYKKVDYYLPCDFLHYYFNGDCDYLRPIDGYFCHLMGYDGGDCDLNMFALNITFPLRCLVCEYYMHKMMDKYPILKEACL